MPPINCKPCRVRVAGKFYRVKSDGTVIYVVPFGDDGKMLDAAAVG